MGNGNSTHYHESFETVKFDYHSLSKEGKKLYNLRQISNIHDEICRVKQELNNEISNNPKRAEMMHRKFYNYVFNQYDNINKIKLEIENLDRENFEQLNNLNIITSEELANARKMWGDALVSISTTNDERGLQAATQLARQVIDEAYGYNFGPVLFKPTLTSGDHTFRTTSDGALSYFVGQNNFYPDDTGFALKGWRKADIETKAEFNNGDVAMWMGIVTLTDKNENKVKVDKSWGYKKDNDGKLRIVLHLSSLPYVR